MFLVEFEYEESTYNLEYEESTYKLVRNVTKQ